MSLNSDGRRQSFVGLVTANNFPSGCGEGLSAKLPVITQLTC